MPNKIEVNIASVNASINDVAVEVNIGTPRVDSGINNVIAKFEGGGDPYEGPYTVTPAIQEQELKTENKLMQDDVTIEAIPYASVINPSGGMTVTIG